MRPFEIFVVREVGRVIARVAHGRGDEDLGVTEAFAPTLGHVAVRQRPARGLEACDRGVAVRARRRREEHERCCYEETFDAHSHDFTNERSVPCLPMPTNHETAAALARAHASGGHHNTRKSRASGS